MVNYHGKTIFSPQYLKRNRGKAEEKDYKGQKTNCSPPPTQRGNRIQGWGMAEAKDEEEEDQKDPATIKDDTDQAKGTKGQLEGLKAFLTNQGVEDVASIQLAYGEEVKGGDK